jgi:hypothetical protein
MTAKTKAKTKKVVTRVKKTEHAPIHEYIRRGPNRKPRGVLVGVQEGSVIKIGWSLTNVNSGDKFDKLEGMTRAITRTHTPEAAPSSLNDEIADFQDRCVVYFKNAEAIVTPLIDRV